MSGRRNSCCPRSRLADENGSFRVVALAVSTGGGSREPPGRDAVGNDDNGVDRVDEVPVKWSLRDNFCHTRKRPWIFALAGRVTFHQLIAVLRRDLAMFSADLFSLGLSENPIGLSLLLNWLEPEDL